MYTLANEIKYSFPNAKEPAIQWMQFDTSACIGIHFVKIFSHF